MTEWYCHDCELDKSSSYLGPWDDEDKDYFKNILLVHSKHEGFSTHQNFYT